MSSARPRARAIGLRPGRLPPGPLNAITDVRGVRVGHVSLIEGADVRQLGRIARRGALGLARTGSIAHHGSGDFILAFSTAERVPHQVKEPLLESRALVADAHPLMDAMFLGAVESVEESVLNALLRADTLVGRDGHVREGLPIDRLLELVSKGAA